MPTPIWFVWTWTERPILLQNEELILKRAKKWKGAKIDFGMPPREGEGIGNQSSFQSCNSIKARTFFTEELEFNFRAKKSLRKRISYRPSFSSFVRLFKKPDKKLKFCHFCMKSFLSLSQLPSYETFKLSPMLSSWMSQSRSLSTTV